MAKLKSVPQVSAVEDSFQTNLVSKSGKVALGQVQWSAKESGVKDGNLNAVQ